MKIYILGICGTFMAGIAQIARELGCEVAGSDANVYPPMSTQLEQAGIELSPPAMVVVAVALACWWAGMRQVDRQGVQNTAMGALEAALSPLGSARAGMRVCGACRGLAGGGAAY